MAGIVTQITILETAHANPRMQKKGLEINTDFKLKLDQVLAGVDVLVVCYRGGKGVPLKR